ncbi:S16 family serine protease, partial [Escherichia coli]|uniref:S16 family serine protease n=1 Tax=Escherichia coli TaxID=562 RepID=UPI003F28C422
ENRKDLADIPANVTRDLKIVPVKYIEEVLDLALERPLAPKKARKSAQRVTGRSTAKPSGSARVKHGRALSNGPKPASLLAFHLAWG